MILDPFLVVSVDRTTFCGVTARPQLAPRIHDGITLLELEPVDGERVGRGR